MINTFKPNYFTYLMYDKIVILEIMINIEIFYCKLWSGAEIANELIVYILFYLLACINFDLHSTCLCE